MKPTANWHRFFIHYNKSEPVKTLEDLARDVTQALKDNHHHQALQYAEMAAVNYFAPGLLLLLKVQLAECKTLIDEGSSCESHLGNCFVVYTMCKQLATEQSDISELVGLLQQMKELGLSAQQEKVCEVTAKKMLEKAFGDKVPTSEGAKVTI